MEKKKIWVIIQIIALAVQVIAEVLATVILIQLDMLPDRYLAVLILVMVVLVMYISLFMFVKIKGSIRLWRRITSYVLALLIACGCLLICKFAIDARNVLHGVTGGDLPDTRNTYVLVLDEDAAHTLPETKGYRYGAVENYDVEHTQQMIDVIEQETAETIAITYYQKAMVMVDALYNQEVDALIMNGASISLLIEQENYEDFLTKVRILHTLPFKDTQVQEPTKDKEEVVQSPFIVYISGSDTRSQKLTVSLSDVNILAAVNPQTKQILLINTPRDYFVPNPAGKGKLDKLTHCGNYGVECSMEALEGLYDIQIDYYGRINFAGFEKFIDAIGGVTVVSDETFTANHRTYITKGENKLDGQGALDFARERYHLAGGDNARGKHQMRVIKAVVDKISSSSTLISNYSSILNSLEGMFATSFRAEEISNLVKMQLNDMAKWDVRSFAVTGTGDMEETYSWAGQELYVMWPNEDTVAYASDLVGRVMNGEILTDADMTMPKQ